MNDILVKAISNSNSSIVFDNSSIISLAINNQTSLCAKDFAYDTMELTVHRVISSPEIFKPADSSSFRTSDEYDLSGFYYENLRYIEYGAKLMYYLNGELKGVYYFKSVDRTKKSEFKIEAVSEIGLLDKKKYFGKVYTGDSFKEVLKDILTKGENTNQIPLDYQEVEYIDLINGGSYLDTGLKPGSGVVTKMEYMRTSISTGCLFGETSSVTGYSKYYSFGFSSSYAKYGYGSTKSYTTSTSVSANTKSSIIFSGYEEGYSGRYFTIDENDPQELPGYFSNATNTMYLFANNQDGTATEKFVGRVYSCRIDKIAQSTSSYDTGSEYSTSPLHYYIPCYKKDTLEVGFYDLVEEKFTEIVNSNSYTSCGDSVGVNSTEYEFEYDCDEDLGKQKVYGWLPYSTKREALSQLIFAYNVKVTRDTSFKPKFECIDSKTESTNISENTVYVNGTYAMDETVSRVEIFEHSFTPPKYTEEECLYNDPQNGLEVTSSYVYFDNAPIYVPSIRTTGSLVLEQVGPNFAVISGHGGMYGIPYVHFTKGLGMDNPNASTENVTTISDATLISILNSTNVLKRVYNYYCNAFAIEFSVAKNELTTGEKYSIPDPFDGDDGRKDAYLEEYTEYVNSTGSIRYACKFVSNFEPLGFESMYTSSMLLTGSGSLNISTLLAEKSVSSITAVLISSGNNGTSGKNGYSGNPGDEDWLIVPDSFDATDNYLLDEYDRGGEGGSGGAGGKGGLIKSVTISDPSGSYAYSCGSTTIFGSYSTASGAQFDEGIVNLFTRERFAVKGEDGIAGAIGGISYVNDDGEYVGYVEYNGATYTNGALGSSKSGTWEFRYFVWEEVCWDEFDWEDDGDGGGSYVYLDTVCENQNVLKYEKIKYHCQGGYGGGAAAGVNGSSGGDAIAPYYKADTSSDAKYWLSTNNTYLTLSDGGNGASPSRPEAAAGYGYGGTGGSGGGGGGSAGYIQLSSEPSTSESTGQSGSHTFSSTGDSYTVVVGTAGTGGTGSAGGVGGPGAIIVYY